jgi:hypothetical protein
MTNKNLNSKNSIKQEDKPRLLASNPDVGRARFRVYAHVLGRIKSSLNAGFYLETIALTESFISDRLDSFMSAKKIRPQRITGLGCYLNGLKNNLNGFDSELLDAVIAWKNKRNKSLHGMAKFSTLEEADWNQKVENCRICAVEGEKIANEVKKMVDKLRRQSIKERKNTLKK